MPELKRVVYLEIEQDVDFAWKEWKIQHWGWFGMLIVVAAGLLGLFGEGLLSHSIAGAPPLEGEYGRFERLLSPSEIVIHVLPPKAPNGEVRVQVDRDFLSHYTLRRIVPEPDSTELSPGWVTHIFKVGDEDGQPLDITFQLESNQIGITRGRIGVQNGPSVEITQLIYP